MVLNKVYSHDNGSEDNIFYNIRLIEMIYPILPSLQPKHSDVHQKNY